MILNEQPALTSARFTEACVCLGPVRSLYNAPEARFTVLRICFIRLFLEYSYGHNANGTRARLFSRAENYALSSPDYIMIPVLFEIGEIRVYSFGVMMGLSFLIGNYLFAKEMCRRGIAEEIAGTVTLLALIAGVAGAKLFSLFENWEAFIANPINEMFSASGLTFYGGLIMAIIAIFFYLRAKKIPFIRVADAASPALIMAYGIGRIGCQLSGDGDYGIPSKLAWAMTYPEGTVPTNGYISQAAGGMLSELGRLYEQMYGGPVPDQVPVHPAPVYETLASLAIFAVLWFYFRKRPMPAGKVFAIYLILAGMERLLVEFIRLNPLYLGLSQAQWISVAMIVVGAFMLYKRRGAAPEDFSKADKRSARAGTAAPRTAS